MFSSARYEYSNRSGIKTYYKNMTLYESISSSDETEKWLSNGHAAETYYTNKNASPQSKYQPVLIIVYGVWCCIVC